MQSRFGKLSFADVLQPAIKLATDGYPISKFFVAETIDHADRIKDPEWHRVFRPNSGWKPGDILKLTDLAGTLNKIAEEGIGYLYGGELGAKLTQHMESVGGVISINDLETVEPILEVPVKATYRDHLVHVLALVIGHRGFERRDHWRQEHRHQRPHVIRDGRDYRLRPHYERDGRYQQYRR